MVLVLLLLAAPLPADVWSVGADGKSCVQLEESLAAELATWREDSESSMPDEGVFGRVNPRDARQLVLLFASKKVCERIVWAVGEENKGNRPSRRLDEKQIREQVEALAATEAIKKVWARLSAREKTAVHADAKTLFAGDANRVRARKRIAALGKKKEKKRTRVERAQLGLWLELYAIVFAEAYVSEEAEAEE